MLILPWIKGKISHLELATIPWPFQDCGCCCSHCWLPEMLGFGLEQPCADAGWEGRRLFPAEDAALLSSFPSQLLPWVLGALQTHDHCRPQHWSAEKDNVFNNFFYSFKIAIAQLSGAYECVPHDFLIQTAKVRWKHKLVGAQVVELIMVCHQTENSFLTGHPGSVWGLFQFDIFISNLDNGIKYAYKIGPSH